MTRGLFLACWVTLASTVHADDAGGVRALDVTSVSFEPVPTRIILGDTEGVEVVLVARGADGAPLDVAPPRLTASTGTVSAPERVEAGRWKATFTPPRERFPHVAIVFGVIETQTTSAVGFVPLHLWGRGQTVVKTKAGSQVTVFIGNESFGPVAADSEGEARVPIIVPPGPERAVAKSVDSLGNESQKTIDLGVPSFNRLAMIALDDVTAADGTGAARLLAFAVDRKGDPLFDARFIASSSVGTVDAAEGVSPGMFRIVLRPGTAERGIARVDLALEGAPGSSARADIQLLSGSPARAALDTRLGSLTADDPREVTVDVRIYDRADNIVPGQAASVDVDVGRIESIKPIAGGQRVTWLIPAKTAQRTAKITARSQTGAVLGERSVALLPGKAAVIRFEDMAPVVADGSTALDVRLRIEDRVGNAIVPRGAKVSVVDERLGQIVGATVDGTVYRARFVPEPRDNPAYADLRAEADGMSTTTRVELLPRPRARLLVGPGVVANVVNNNSGALGLGPELSLLVRLPGFDGSVHAGVEVAMYQSVLGAPVDRRDFPVLLEGAWRPFLTPDLGFHLGGGAGIALSDVIVPRSGGGGLGESRVRRTVEPSLAAQAVAGVAYRLGPGFVEADLRAGYSLNLSGPTQGAVNSGPPVGVGLVLGYRFGI